VVFNWHVLYCMVHWRWSQFFLSKGNAMNKPYDPVEHHRTTQPHAGVAFRSMVAIPVLLLIIGGVVGAVSALAAAGYMRPHWAALMGGLAVLIGSIGVALSVVEHRRIRRNEARWVAEDKGNSA